MKRFNISISDGLLKLIDEAAEQEFTSRSAIIRTAVLWYLRPQSRELDQTDPEVVLQTLQKRHAKLAVRKMLSD